MRELATVVGGFLVIAALAVIGIRLTGLWGTVTVGWGGHPSIAVPAGPAPVPEIKPAPSPTPRPSGNEEILGAINQLGANVSRRFDNVEGDITDLKKRVGHLEEKKPIPNAPVNSWGPPQ